MDFAKPPDASFSCTTFDVLHFVIELVIRHLVILQHNICGMSAPAEFFSRSYRFGNRFFWI